MTKESPTLLFHASFTFNSVNTVANFLHGGGDLDQLLLGIVWLVVSEELAPEQVGQVELHASLLGRPLPVEHLQKAAVLLLLLGLLLQLFLLFLLFFKFLFKIINAQHYSVN